MAQEDVTILVVEDDSDIRELLLFNLGKEGYAARGAASAEAALAFLRERKADLAVLDLMLPGMDGMALCRRLRGDPDLAAMPILMLTARGEEADVVSGLEAGADDYVVKPFSPKVLLARVRSLLRRGARNEGEIAGGGVVERGAIVVNPERREVLVAGGRIDLTATEFKILHCLARRPGIVFTRAQLLDLVHGDLHAVTDRAIDVQIVGLRRKLGRAAAAVETVRGTGYRFTDRW
jgi:two-component system phosphate regulon response regulator PhoB